MIRWPEHVAGYWPRFELSRMREEINYSTSIGVHDMVLRHSDNVVYYLYLTICHNKLRHKIRTLLEYFAHNQIVTQDTETRRLFQETIFI
jgi:hypothetical protein